jgi:hypothetical protein
LLLPWFDRKDTTVNAYVLAALAGGLLITGSPATLRAGRSLSASPGGVKITGVSSSLKVGRKVNASIGQIKITGSAASLRTGRELSGGVGQEKITGSAASLRAGREVQAGVGSVRVNGFAADLVFASAANAELVAEPGAVSLAGVSAGLTYTPIPPPPEPIGHSWGTPNRGRLIASFPHRAYALDLGAGWQAMRGVGADLVVTRNPIPAWNEEAMEVLLLIL